LIDSINLEVNLVAWIALPVGLFEDSDKCCNYYPIGVGRRPIEL